MSNNVSEILKGVSNDYSAFSRKSEIVEDIPLEEIYPDPNQVRKSSNSGFINDDSDTSEDSLSDLVRSIEVSGVRQPIIVRNNPMYDATYVAPEADKGDFNAPSRMYTAKYMIVCGERRYRASCKANRKLKDGTKEKIKTIPAVVRSYESEYDIRYDQVTENVQRAALNPFEMAMFVANLKKKHQEETGEELKSSEIAMKLGKPKAWLSKIEKFSKCPEYLMPFFASGKITSAYRIGYDLMCLYEKSPSEFEALFPETCKLFEVISSDALKYLKKGIEEAQKLVSSIEESDEHEESSFLSDDSESISVMDEQNEETSILSEDLTEGDGDDDIHEQKEKSAIPSMAPAYQENDAHTAGIGKPDFTDRDTKSDHDLSDRMSFNSEDLQELSDNKSDDEFSEDVEPTKQNNLGRGNIQCSFNDPDTGSLQWGELLVYEHPDDENSGWVMLNETGERKKVPLEIITLVKFVE